MLRIYSAVLMALAATAAFSAGQEPVPADQTLPASDINRESNNPAKAAIKAREAQEKDKANLEGMAEAVSGSPLKAAADDLQLVRNVETALRNDTRTAKLGVSVKLDEDKMLGLHGVVSSSESRTAAIAVATNVAGAARVKSYLTVAGK